MKIDVRNYFSEAHGTLKAWDIVLCRLGEGHYARSKVKPAQPRTEARLKVASNHTLASRVWKQLTDAERETWVQFAQTWAEPGKKPRRGVDVCREAARVRINLGLEPVRQAPALAYPPKVRDVRLESTADAREFRLRVEHGIDTPAGYLLMVRITPPRNAGRTPTSTEARCICGPGPGSAAPLPVSGGTVIFANARYGVEPGGKVGIAAVIVREADGLASAETFFVVMKPAAETGDGG